VAKQNTPKSPGSVPDTGIASGSSELALILEAAGGNEDAFNILATRYSPLIASSVNAYSSSFGPQDLEELSQEALLAFHRAVVKYDPLYGDVTFGLYAKVCISNALKSEVKRRNKEAAEAALPLELDLADEIPSYSDEADMNVRTAELRETIRNNLSDYENLVFWSYYAGLSSSEIAKQTEKSQKSVENAIFRIRNKLKSILK